MREGTTAPAVLYSFQIRTPCELLEKGRKDGVW